MQIGRLFEIVYILLDKKSVTARELGERFGVSRRTICRDIDALSAAGIPIYTERGRGGGISLLPGFVLNKSLLSDGEQNEILAALYGLSSINADASSEILQKLSTLFQKSTADWMKVEFAGWTHENDFFDRFKAAILGRRVVEFDYYNSYGDKTPRRVEPMQVWFKSRAWYLKGFCTTKLGIRLYKVSRIKNLVVTDETFAARNDATDMGGESAGFHPDTPTITLRIAPERAYRVYDDFYEGMAQKQPDGSFIVTIKWPQDNWLHGFILSYGRYIEVIGPENLREAIRDEARKIFEKYL